MFSVMDRDVIRHWLFVVALALYGVFGAPTPDHLSWVEITVGVLLVVAVPPRGVMALFAPGASGGGCWYLAGQCLLFWGLLVPLMAGVMGGHGMAAILRDVIPFLFMMMPLFYAVYGGMTTRLWWAVAMVGVLFSVRLALTPGGDPLYLAIAPTVVFAAIMLAAGAGGMMMRSLSLRTLALAVLAAVLAGLCFAALAATLQRASIFLGVAAVLFLLGVALWRAPLRALVPVVVLAVAVVVFHDVLGGVAAGLAHKQGLVGLNMRLQEAEAVFDALAGSPFHILFGLGWGAQMESPAVGGMSVGYTHNLLTYLWLKTGLVGLLCGAVYLFWLGVGVIRAFPRNPVLAAGLGVPLAIDTLLYASFKSLDFGLILLLCALLARSAPSCGAVAPRPDLV